MVSSRGIVSLIPLGGQGEIGKNMWVVEYNQEILVIDAGVMFPDEEMPGIDIVIPDISYLTERSRQVKAIVLTHGHEDHIGALPYVLRQLQVPVYGTRLTLGLAQGKLREHGMDNVVPMIPVRAGESLRIGSFKVDFINVNHSIADVVALAVHTPVGTIVHTADFKFDHTPVDGMVTDFRKFAELGDQGVLVLLSDSTNVERPGYTPSERALGENFEEFFRQAHGRIIVASFASNIHRVQQIVNAAAAHGRKVAFAGRSMINVATIAMDLGYLQVPPGMLIDLEDVDLLPPNRVAIITTGSQGEPMSALSRMANAEHRYISIIPGDTVIISASTVPGNEKLVARTINYLFKQGARVLYEAVSGVHVSGHASQEELKLMLNLTRPKFFVPIHGEYRHLVQHAGLAAEVCVPRENIFIAENGDVLEFTPDSGRVGGRIAAGPVLVDGLGVGDVGQVVLRDRRQLAQDGILIIALSVEKETGQVLAGPDVVTRGFVYVKESEALIEDIREQVRQIYQRCRDRRSLEWLPVKTAIREDLARYLYERTKRRPMILPIILEI
ncbi:MAG: ribonuclease J [Firmicutes bacterium]|nr:ribonuclease J [Bacillota bacterium]